MVQLLEYTILVTLLWLIFQERRYSQRDFHEPLGK